MSFFSFSCGSLTALLIVLKPVFVFRGSLGQRVMLGGLTVSERVDLCNDVCTISTISEIGVGTDITL